MKQIKLISLLASMCALSAILSIVDGYISKSLLLLVPLGIMPVIKLGLSNIVVVVFLYIFPKKPIYTFIICMMKCLITFIFNPSLVTFMFSISAGVFSIIIMVIFKMLISNNKYVILCSAIGGFTHMLAQNIIFVRIYGLTNIENILIYLPVYLTLGLITGIITGFLSKILINRIIK